MSLLTFAVPFVPHRPCAVHLRHAHHQSNRALVSTYEKATKCSIIPCNSSSASLQDDVSRRELLTLLTAAVTLAAIPSETHALSKTRIMKKAGPPTTLPSGVVYRDISIGKGYAPRKGDAVAIHYSLFYDDLEVESSRESQGLAASPLGFTYGTISGPGSIMKGVYVGMEGMKVGGLRLITVPPELSYGSKGRLPLIPPDATVEFAVSLLSCKRQGTNPNSVIDPKAQAF